jgi:hypothetical protein
VEIERFTATILVFGYFLVLMSDNLYVQLIWEEPITGELYQPLLTPPIVIGRDKKEMPEKLGSYPVSQLELIHKQVSRFHALITVANDQMYITDKSSNGTFINGRQIPKGSQIFSNKDTIRIGPYKITALLVEPRNSNNTDINREIVSPNSSVNFLRKNMIFIWLFSGILIIFLATGVGFGIKSILDNLRPNVPVQPINNSKL